MHLVDETVKPKSPQTTLNNIPEGTVFRGCIVPHTTGLPTTGVFYKAQGSMNSVFKNNNNPDAWPIDCVVVRLDRAGVQESGKGNIWTRCSSVLNYEPLNVELRIKGPLL